MLLSKGCSCSTPTVHPANWKSGGVILLNKDWYIQYWFRDPDQPPQWQAKYPYGKLIIVKGMNDFKNLLERRKITKSLLENEISMLQSGYNPINKSQNIPQHITLQEIDPALPFLEACEYARNKLKCSDNTKKDIKSALGFISKSTINLQIHSFNIQQVRRKHISLILDNCKHTKDYWSPHLFNHYRSYLMMLFKKLIELEVIESNPVDEHLPKEETEHKIRAILTDKEVNKILEFYQVTKPDPYYYRFLQIFFHSGSRPIELLKLKPEHVKLGEGDFIVTCRKGKKWREDPRAIKHVARKYWEALITEAKPGQYLFGRNKMMPGDQPATRDYVTKKWQRDIKDPKGLNIQKDLYSLKHKNLDETAAYLTIKEAAAQAGHQSEVITMVYAVGENKRKRDRLRNVPNVLGGAG